MSYQHHSHYQHGQSRQNLKPRQQPWTDFYPSHAYPNPPNIIPTTGMTGLYSSSYSSSYSSVSSAASSTNSSPAVWMARARFDAARSFDLDDDWQYCRALCTDRELDQLSDHYNSSSSSSPLADPAHPALSTQYQGLPNTSALHHAPPYPNLAAASTNNDDGRGFHHHHHNHQHAYRGKSSLPYTNTSKNVPDTTTSPKPKSMPRASTPKTRNAIPIVNPSARLQPSA